MNRHFRVLTSILAALVLATIISACGYRGPLYLPGDEAALEQAGGGSDEEFGNDSSENETADEDDDKAGN